MSDLISCSYCHAEFAKDLRACPRCGAGADITLTLDDGGWMEVPALKDHAEIQFGQSRAEIDGVLVPLVNLKIAENDSVVFEHDRLAWWDGKAKLGVRKGSMFKSMSAGVSKNLVEVSGPGDTGLTHHHAGELVVFPLNAGESVFVKSHHWVLASGTIDISGHRPDRWYEVEKRTDNDEVERETERPMGNYDEFQADEGKPGVVFAHAKGNVFVRKIPAGQAIDIAPHSILAWKDGNDPGFLIERHGWVFGTHHYLSARMEGPVTVWMQSGSMGETEDNREIVRADSRTSWIRNG